MKKVTLNIENLNQSLSVTLDDELSLGRTDLARVVLDDDGLSRINTTIFRDGDEVLIIDENSTNGTVLNGQRISGSPRHLADRDEINIGNHTRISVAIREAAAETLPPSVSVAPAAAAAPNKPTVKPTSPQGKPQPKLMQYLLISAVSFAVLVISIAVGVIFLLPDDSGRKSGNTKQSPTLPVSSGRIIPIRVIDPLGGEDPDDIDDLIASWEKEEDPLKAEDLKEIQSVSKTDPKKPSDLNVPIEFFKTQLNKALYHGATGAEPAGLIQLPTELVGGNVSKQKEKLAQLIRSKGFKQPLDFADLAELRMDGKFVGEMPMATESYVLDIGGSATPGEFTAFDFDNGETKLTPDSPKYKILKRLADNFDGQKYDLNVPEDRKQMRIRLLRMYNKDARPLFEEITKAYAQMAKAPLRVTSLLRSMDYQISLNKTNANSFKVSGKGSLPPHTSGCAFDISRKNLTKDEQNFIMQHFADLERGRKIDSLREGAANACFHTFIYPDGIEPSPPFKLLTENLQPDYLAEPAEFLSLLIDIDY